mgnify:FL=1
MRHGNADAVALPHLDSRPSQGNGSKNRLQVIPDVVVSVGEVVERQGIGSHSWDPPSDPRSACKRLGDSQEVSYEDTSLDVSRLGNFGLAANPETV